MMKLRMTNDVLRKTVLWKIPDSVMVANTCELDGSNERAIRMANAPGTTSTKKSYRVNF